jgi:hypothetical protein
MRALVMRMVYDRPHFTLCCTMTHIKVGNDWMNEHEHKVQALGLMHEINHDLCRHVPLLRNWSRAQSVPCPGGSLPFVNQTAQIALDYQDNDMIFRTVGWLPDEFLHDPSMGGALDPETVIYKNVFHRMFPNWQQGDPPPVCNISWPGAFPDDLDVSEMPDEGTEQEQAQDDAMIRNLAVQTLRDISNSGRARGFGGAEFERMIERVRPTGVLWQREIKRQIRSKMGQGQRSWSVPNRRGLGLGTVLPGSYSEAAGFIFVAVDTSGSMGEEDLGLAAGGLEEIFVGCQPEQMMILDIDAAVHDSHCRDVSSISELRAIKSFKGGGGTDMRLVFDYLKQKQLAPDLLIIITDMGTPFPDDHKPAKDCIWIATRDGDWDVPKAAGRVVTMRTRLFN